MERFLSVAEVAARLGLRTETILRKIHSGELAASVMPGGQYRITESELDKILKPVSKDSGKTGSIS